MSTHITKILPEEYIDKGVIGLEDAPELETLEMQHRFDEIAIDVIIPHINGMADEIDAAVDGVADAVVAESVRAQAAEAALDAKINTKMSIAVYDSNNNGIVDDSEKLGGHAPSYYSTSSDLESEVSRAQAAEQALRDSISAENTRAEREEQRLYDAINAETYRAQLAEAELSGEITEKLDTLGLSVVDGKLCITYRT